MTNTLYGSESDPLLPRHLRRDNLQATQERRWDHRSVGSRLSVYGPWLLALSFCTVYTLATRYPSQLSRHISAAETMHLSVPHVPLSFLALGDWGRQGKHGQRHVANAMADTIDRTIAEKGYNPYYIISTGDNFYKSGVASVRDSDFNKSYTDVYNHTPLTNVPWFSILGNHDHLGSISAQVEFSSHEPRWNMPATYYAHRFADDLLAIFLDTTPFVSGEEGDIARQKNRQRTAPQLAWLKKQLAETPKNSYFFVIGHHNMYTMSKNGHLGSPELRAALEPILMPYKNRIIAYISGHEHALMHMQPYPSTDDANQGKATTPYSPIMDHFISGAGSKLDAIKIPEGKEAVKLQECCGVIPESEDTAIPRTVWGESVHGFFMFRFDGQLFKATAIDKEGRAIYEYEKKVT